MSDEYEHVPYVCQHCDFEADDTHCDKCNGYRPMNV